MVGGFDIWLGGQPGSTHYASGTNHLINDGNWHHLVFSIDRTGTGVTYFDGQPVDARDETGVGDLNNSGATVNIGNDTTGVYPWSKIGGTHAEADIDDLGIWRRALSPYECESIYLVGQNYGRSFDAAAPVTVTLGLQRVGAALQLNWTSGTLQSADNVTGPWTPVTGASVPSYQVTPTATKKFYRVQL